MRTPCSAVCALVLAACLDRPAPLVLCHNSNCSEPHDPSRDDTLEAMRDSFALVGADGITPIDGIELDLLRHAGQCLFAHDTDHIEGHVDIRDGATAVADYLVTHARASHNGQQFNVKLELKPSASGLDEELAQIDCALDVYAVLRDAAIASSHRVEFVFDSYDPGLLRLVQDRRPPDLPQIWTKLSIDLGVPPPLRDDNYPLAELTVPVEIAEVHGGWITDTALRALRSKNVAFSVWSFDITRETLDEIEHIRPRYALTGQARTLRAWLDD